jgi:hypothetical protein
MEDIKTIPIEGLLNSLIVFSIQSLNCNLSLSIDISNSIKIIRSEIIRRCEEK